jgi:SAM-dependent methyltransferase
VSDNPYEAVAYPTFAEARTHPDRLAAVATLFGMTAPPLAACRVLELGCGDGGNLIPMAYALPQARFTGIDLAESAVARGQRVIQDLQLTNIRMLAADVRDIGGTLGEFDYIIAHGLYSWVAADARDALLAVCGASLGACGVALVSYNAWPGRHIRQMLREMMLHVTRGTREPAARMAQARGFLETLLGSGMAPPSWREMLEHEVGLLVESAPGSFWHDDLAPINQPVYFHQFAAHAAAHGLACLGDADTHLMFDPRGVLREFADDWLEREQVLDFLLCRPFRMSLVCRAGAALDRRVTPQRMERFLFAAPPGGLHGIRVARGHPSLEQVTAALADTYPLPAAFEELMPYAESRQELREILYALVTTGFASFHVHDFPCQENVTARPRASRLARYQAAASPLVTNLCHTLVKLDEPGRALILTLDGTRNREEIGEPQALEWMARMALLEG